MGAQGLGLEFLEFAVGPGDKLLEGQVQSGVMTLIPTRGEWNVLPGGVTLTPLPSAPVLVESIQASELFS